MGCVLTPAEWQSQGQEELHGSLHIPKDYTALSSYASVIKQQTKSSSKFFKCLFFFILNKQKLKSVSEDNVC